MQLVTKFLHHAYRVFGVLAEPHSPRPAQTIHMKSPRKRQCPLRSLPSLRSKSNKHS